MLARVLLVVALLALGRTARAQRVYQDAGVQGQEALDQRLKWHDTRFIWDHSATTQTLGIGSDVQSRNPTYEMSFRILPRFYLWERPGSNLSVRGDIQLIREFTNSDVTTRRGEWTFTDGELSLLLIETLRDDPRTMTNLVVRAPWVRLPTSKASYRSGRLVSTGLSVGLDQALPFREDPGPLSMLLLRPRFAYLYHFSRTTVPTNDEIDRVRLMPGGTSLPSDQLSGTAFPEHELALALRAETEVIKDLGFAVDLGMRYARRHALSETEICGVVVTGCVRVKPSEDAPRWGVATLFSAGFSYGLGHGFELYTSYSNFTGQLGANGQRRNFFYSPDARVSLSLGIVLDEIFTQLRAKPAKSASLSPSRAF